MVEKKIEAVTLPLGIALTESDGAVTIMNAARDSGDAFALFFLGVIIALFAAAIGDKIAGSTGIIAALLASSPAWGLMFIGALKRAVNSVTVVAKKGVIDVVRGPIGKTVQRFEEKDVSSIVSRMSEHRSTTRGGSQTIQRTHSVWVNLANGKDALLLEPLDTEPQAKFVEKSLWRALRSGV